MNNLERLRLSSSWVLASAVSGAKGQDVVVVSSLLALVVVVAAAVAVVASFPLLLPLHHAEEAGRVAVSFNLNRFGTRSLHAEACLVVVVSFL